jgi:hypothetical protein
VHLPAIWFRKRRRSRVRRSITHASIVLKNPTEKVGTPMMILTFESVERSRVNRSGVAVGLLAVSTWRAYGGISGGLRG